MSGNQALGVLAVVIGVALLVLQAPILRAWSERDTDERAEPMQRAAGDHWATRSPKWMRGLAFDRVVNRLWLNVVGLLFIYAGGRFLAVW